MLVVRCVCAGITTASWPASLSIEARAGLSSAGHDLLSEQGLQLVLPDQGNDERGQRLPPEQHRVVVGPESAGMTSAAIKQRVLALMHKAELEEMGILQDGGEDGASETSLAGGISGGALGAGDYATDGDDLEDGDLG